MKKLQKLALHKAKTLTFPEMKQITGGYDGGTCCARSSHLGQPCALCGHSKETVEGYADAFGTNWCCDSCGSTSGWGDVMCEDLY